jgi:serine/threonine-protein kinase
VHLALGQLYRATGQPVPAEREYRRAVALDPDLVEARIGVAMSMKQQGRAGPASLEYQQAIELRPRYWLGYDAYGSFLVEQGRLPDALAHYRRGIELAPRNATLLSNLGAALFLSGDFAGAADAFRRSVEIAPTSEGYSNTGTNYFYAGRYADAAVMFENATKLAPEDYQLWGNLGDAYRRTAGEEELTRGTYLKAAELAQLSLGVNPESALTRAALAYFMVRLGDTKEATIQIDAATAADSTDLNTHYYAALVYKELGNLEAAASETRQALAAGYPATLLRADPEFGPMISSPEVAELMGATDESQADDEQ